MRFTRISSPAVVLGALALGLAACDSPSVPTALEPGVDDVSRAKSYAQVPDGLTPGRPLLSSSGEAGASASGNTTITFSSPSLYFDNTVPGPGQAFNEGDYVVTSFWYQSGFYSGHFHIYDGAERHHYQGTHARQGVRIRRADGGKFSLQSIDTRGSAAVLEVGTAAITEVSGNPTAVTGYAQLPLAATGSWTTTKITGFEDVTEVWITSRDSRDWDNIVLGPGGPVDETPPVITPTVTGTLGDNGWYTSDVSVSWSVADAESDISSQTGCEAVTVTEDTDGATFTCTATSLGGSSSETVAVNRDATVPEIGYSDNEGDYTVDEAVAISCSASDAMSGLASTTCQDVHGEAYTFDLGANTYSAIATDQAGNENGASTSFSVRATAASLCSLTKRWVSRAGVANSLCVKLNAAEAAGLRGNTSAKQGAIDAYINEVEAQTGKTLSSANAAVLIRLARAL